MLILILLVCPLHMTIHYSAKNRPAEKYSCSLERPKTVSMRRSDRDCSMDLDKNALKTTKISSAIEQSDF